MLFVDFKQEYDSIVRSTLWNVMIALGIPAKLVRMVKAYMINARCKVKFNSVISEELTLNKVVRQGDALSPVLFNIAFESVVRGILKSELQGLNIGQGKQIALATYADDIVVIKETEDSLKRTADILSEEADKIGLIINENKTKFMIVSRREHPQNAITIEDMSFERVWNFKYLGVDINSQIATKKYTGESQLATNSIVHLSNYFNLKYYKKKKTKIKLYKTLVD